MADAVMERIATGFGVYCLMPREDYDKMPGRNSSLLKLLATRTPAHAWNAYLAPKRLPGKSSAAFRVGSLLHQLLLEPKVLEGVQICSSGPTTKIYKEAEAAAKKAGVEFAQEDEYQLAAAMADAVLAHPTLAPYFEPTPQNLALNELTLQWPDPHGPELCKARLDAVRVTDEGILCLDLKTTQDAGPVEFGKSAANFLYTLQGAFYADGMFYCAEALEKALKLPAGQLQGKPVTFEFVAVEKEKPHLVARYQLTAEQASMGRQLYRRALSIITEASAANTWAGYSTEPQPLTMPTWAINQHESYLSLF